MGSTQWSNRRQMWWEDSILDTYVPHVCRYAGGGGGGQKKRMMTSSDARHDKTHILSINKI